MPRPSITTASRAKRAVPAAPTRQRVATRPAQKQPRRDRDAYITPLTLARAICDRLAFVIPSPARVVEPSAGTGNFVQAVKAVWAEAVVMAVDIHREHSHDLHLAGAASYVTGDWVAQDVRGFKPDLIIGNPPFSHAEVHATHALAQLEDGGHLAFLLPVSFLCGQGRAKRLWSRPAPFGGLRYYLPIAERPSFTNDGQTDMSEYAVFVWKKGYDANPMVLPHLWLP